MFFKKKKKDDQTQETVSPPKEEIPKVSPIEIQETKKQRKEKVIKIISSVLVLGSFSLLIYSVFLLIHDSATSYNGKDSYITLTGSNIAKSKEVYSQFGNKKKKKASDYALIGTKFFLSETKITPELLSIDHTKDIVGEGNTNFYLYNISTNQSKFALGQTYISNNVFYIDLDKVEEGDYLIYSDNTNSINKSDFNPYSLSTNESISITSYSLPDEDGIRKRITIKNNSISPYLLISVNNCGTTLPPKYYDAVIYYSQYEKEESGSDFIYLEDRSQDDISALNAQIEKDFNQSIYKIKVATSLQDAYDTNCNKAFALSSNESDVTSLYTIGSNTNLKTNQLPKSSSLAGYDANPEIRELLGYLGHAGENNLNVSGNDIQVNSSSHVGKEGFILSDSSDIKAELLSRLK